MPQASTDQSEFTFEQALARLQEVIVELETGSLSLDDTVVRFREASELAGRCQRLIAEAELRITELASASESESEPSATAGFTQAPF